MNAQFSLVYYLYDDDFEGPDDERIEIEAASDGAEFAYTLDLPLRLPCANHMVQNCLKAALKTHITDGNAFLCVKNLVASFRRSDATGTLYRFTKTKWLQCSYSDSIGQWE